MNTQTQETARIRHNLQCPECFGVRITARMSRFQAQPEGWQCEECGCQWSPPVNWGVSPAMRPLLERLRDPAHAEADEKSSLGDLCREAADVIERMQAGLKRAHDKIEEAEVMHDVNFRKD